MLKLAQGCNLSCPHCYWYQTGRSPSDSARMNEEVVQQLLMRAGEYIRSNRLSRFSFGLHGGEPLLFPKQRMIGLLEEIKILGQECNCSMSTRLQTNAVLLDREWASIFAKYKTNITASIDGPASINDKRRIDRLGRGTHDKIVKGLGFLKAVEHPFSLLAVYDESSEASVICDHLISKLGARAIDVLFPDGGIVDLEKMANFYNDLFDLWWSKYAQQEVLIRISYGVFQAVLGRPPVMEALGRSPMSGVVVDTDGTFLPGDTISSSQNVMIPRSHSVFNSSISKFLETPIWRSVHEKSVSVPSQCIGCRVEAACGGGFLPHRWTPERGFDSPSKFCVSLKSMYTHAAKRLLA